MNYMDISYMDMHVYNPLLRLKKWYILMYRHVLYGRTKDVALNQGLNSNPCLK